MLCDVSTDLGVALKGWALTDEPVTPAANLALFSSFSNILFIPPFKKYSWQTLQRGDGRGGRGLRMSQAPESPAEGAAAGNGTCGTTRCGPPRRTSWSSGGRPGSSWPGRTRSACARPRSARARSCQSRPLGAQTNGRSVKRTLSMDRTLRMVSKLQSSPSEPKLRHHFTLTVTHLCEERSETVALKNDDRAMSRRTTSNTQRRIPRSHAASGLWAAAQPVSWENPSRATP